VNQRIGTLNYQWAFSLIHYFSLQGVSQAVISPGSRSTPLALACEKHPQIEARIAIDERSGGFFALGMAQADLQPVILICTSGSAVANWLPAVVEASYSYTSLILLSADRPCELHNCGANQTIDQTFIFSPYVREFIQLEHPDTNLLNSPYLKQTAAHAYKTSSQSRPGPVHINIPLREPLLPRRFTSDELNNFIDHMTRDILHSSCRKIHCVPDPQQPDPAALKQIQKTLNKPGGLIICGRLTIIEQAGLQALLEQLAHTLNCPVLVDPLSGLRLNTLKNTDFIVNYDTFLDQAEYSQLAPEWIIHFGQFPLSKKLLQYLEQFNCPRILISSYGDCYDPLHKKKIILYTLPATFCWSILPLLNQQMEILWLSQWQTAEKQAQQRIQQALSGSDLFEGHIINALLKHIPDQSLVFSGNSMTIRDFDTFINQQNSALKSLSLFANRGASGIDGNLSTFAGLMSARPGQYTLAVVGDVTFYHDMNGLLLVRDLQAQAYSGAIIIINNGGGGIFNYLPPAQLNTFDKLWKTDTGLNFKYSAQLYNLNYYKITHLKELDEQLAAIFVQSGISIIEIIINPQTSVKCHKQI